MTIENIEVFTRNATVRTIVYVRNDAGELENCTNVCLIYFDEEGTNVNTVNASGTTTGIYVNYFQTNANLNVGDWRIEANVVDGSNHSFVYGGFRLEEGL